MRFIGFLLLPSDRLIRAYQSADSAKPAPIDLLEPAVRTSLRPVKIRDVYSAAIGIFSDLIYPVRADHRAEIASLAPGFINLKFHRLVPVLVGYAR